MMKKRWLLSSLSLFVLAGAGVFLVYPRPKTQYCWVVFGSEGKTRVLVRAKGEAFAVDGDADGDLNGLHKRFNHWTQCRDVTITDPVRKTTYIITRLGGQRVFSGVFRSAAWERLTVFVDIKGPLEYHQYCDVEMRDNAEQAAVAHFHGPLTVQAQKINWRLPPDLALRRGEEPTDLRAYIGTLEAAKGCWVVVQSEDWYQGTPFFPAGVHPVAEIEFSTRGVGAPPIKRLFPLDKTC
jgi:hypothetical protein